MEFKTSCGMGGELFAVGAGRQVHDKRVEVPIEGEDFCPVPAFYTFTVRSPLAERRAACLLHLDS